ncbi:MAG: zinc-ribbon domain-containing protein [Rhodobiaceae bacterium]|nr:zinc-ribbon domain-containing protein [Rhodobiaceae bacterium]
MIISCPSCTTKYQVEASGFMPKGRKVRCAKCGDTWHQDPPKDIPKTLDETDEVPVEAKEAAPPPPAKDDTAPAEKTAPASAGSEAVAARRMAAFRKTLTRWRMGQVAGFAGLGLFVGATLLALYSFKDELVAAWPATASLYAVLNEPVNPQRMEFQNVAYEHQYENGLPVLSITGEVVNVGDARLSVPRVRVGLRDEGQNELYAWTFALPEPALEPSETAEFVTRLSSPPIDARDLEIRFLDQTEEMNP